MFNGEELGLKRVTNHKEIAKLDQKSMAEEQLNRKPGGFLGEALTRLAGNVVIGPTDIAYNAINLLPGKHPNPIPGLEKAFGAENPELVDELIRGMSGYGPVGAATATASKIPLIANALQKITQKGKVGRYLGAALPEMAGGGLYGALENPEHPGVGAAIGIGGGSLTPAIGSTVNALSNPKQTLQRAKDWLTRKTVGENHLPIEEIERRAALAGESPIPFGEIAGSPRLQSIEDTLFEAPFTGGDTIKKNITENTEEIAGTALSKILGGKTKGQVKEQTNALLPTEMKAQKAASEARYQKVKDDAVKVNFNPHVGDALEKIKVDQKIIRKELSEEGKEIFDKALKPPEKSKIVDVSGEPYTKLKETESPLSFEEALSLKQKLYEEGKALTKSASATERKRGKLLIDHSHNLKNSILKSADEFGYTEIASGLKEADKLFKEKVIPFRDKPVANFVEGDKDTNDLIDTFIKTTKEGTKERPIRLERLLSRVQSQDIPLIGEAYLTSAINSEGRILPDRLARLYNDLGEETAARLFSSQKSKDILNNYSEYHQMAQNTMKQSPKTASAQMGQYAQNLAPAAAGGIIGSAVPIIGSGLIGSVLGTVLAGAGGRKALQHLTTPAARQKIINVIKNGAPKRLDKSRQDATINSILQSILAQ